MKITFLSLLVLLTSCSALSQKKSTVKQTASSSKIGVGNLAEKPKSLTLEDAVLGYYKGLYPKSLRNLQWVKNTANYCWVEGDTLFIKPVHSAKVAYFVTLADLKEKVTTLKSFPYVQSIDDKELVFSTQTAVVSYNYIDKMATYTSFSEGAENQDFNPKTKNLAFTVENNLYISQNKKVVAVTENKDKNIVSGQAIHRFEFGITKGTFWSPGGKRLAFYQKDETFVADYPLLNINTTPGSLESIKYPMAGQRSEHAKVGVYNLSNSELVYLKTGEPLDHFLTNLTWSPDEKYIYLAELNRDQNHMQLNQYDAVTGEKIQTLFEEKNEKWVEPEHGLYFLPDNPNVFLWLSEKDGFMNIYKYNLPDKNLEQITHLKWEVEDILGFDKRGTKVIFTGTGEDPREKHVFSVDLKTKQVQRITKESGQHRVLYNKENFSIIDRYSNLETPGVTKIRTALANSRQPERVLLKSKNPLKEYKIGNTEFIKLKSKNGFDLYGRMIKPSNFDASKKYPVLVYVYGGPHAQLVTNSWLGGASLWMHWMAEQGYIIFTLDGRGSAHRGFAFESGIHRHLGKLEVEDQILGVEYLKKQPYVDANRMAVHGWSFGGFMTTSLMLKKPGTFTTGVAGGAVIDWKWYEVMYGERYMDTPQQNPEGYAEASLLDKVENLNGKLMLIHGTVDDVVVMQHSLALVQQCVKKGVQMDYFPYPMHKHNVRGRDRVHLMTKVLNYILENNK